MESATVVLDGKEFTWYGIPIGPVSLVFAKGTGGLVGCGAIDAVALEKFGIAAAKVKPTTADSVRNLDDLLAGEVVVANAVAGKAGVVPGMTGREALVRLG